MTAHEPIDREGGEQVGEQGRETQAEFDPEVKVKGQPSQEEVSGGLPSVGIARNISRIVGVSTMKRVLSSSNQNGRRRAA
jgi:hypothetical protein